VIDPARLTIDQAQLRLDLPILSAVHDAVKAGLEQGRELKALGSSLQCSVNIAVNDERVAAVLKEYLDELDAMFVVSSVELNSPIAPESHDWCYSKEFAVDGAQGVVHVLPPKGSKCSRCWKYIAEEEDGLCGRCDEVVAAGEAL
jgi:isoleucyl-tRNA synthetase